MARVYDLTDTDSIRGTVLGGSVGRIVSSELLADDPPAAYLTASEQPQYALRNTSSGVTLVRSPTVNVLSPDKNHQALAVVTDFRVLFLVGRERGDRSRSLPLDEIVDVDTEHTGTFANTIRIETADNDKWSFSVRGDISAVASYIDEAAQVWATASRLVDETRERLETSREALDDNRFDTAREILGDVTDQFEAARRRVDTVGDGARDALDDQEGELRSRLSQLQREIAAMKGARHHAKAQSTWKEEHDFETAARHYDVATEEYNQALEADGHTPERAALVSRLEGALRERAVLRAAPMADAKAAREVAMAATDPETAAEAWKTALTCYREAAVLDWGESDRNFVVERDIARERAAEATDEAIDAHVEAGEEWLVAADRIAGNGSQRAARQAYKRARNHFQTARDIADNLRQGSPRALTKRIETIDDRLAGKMVAPDVPERDTLSIDAVSAILEESDIDDADPRPAGARSESLGSTPETAEPAPSQLTSPPANSTERTPALLERLRALDAQTMTTIVADLFEATGWRTSVFSATNSAIYDVVAMRDGERRLVWTVHRPDGGALGETIVRRCATARDRSQGTDRATLVTTGTLSSAAQTRATELSVEAIDADSLSDRLEDAGLLGHDLVTHTQDPQA